MADQTRSQNILAAVSRQLQSRGTDLDAADDLGEITITVKLAAGTSWVRGIIWEEERVFRQGAPVRRREDQ